MVAGSIPSNVPRPVSALIGREREMGTVDHLLDDAALVTLTGAGGCGKTRLAAELARLRTPRHPAGTWWIDLGAIADPALVAATIAGVLAVRDIPGEPIIATIARELGDRHALLVIDNCEHLVESVATVTEHLLHSCPKLSVLATGREPLGVEGEVTWRVPSLSLPSDDSVNSIEASESGRLFLDRASRARPNLVVTADSAAAVAAICRRLDGIPLAIELAAARTRVLTPIQIAEGLDDRFRLLTGGSRSALPRQRTLEASVDWSHDLLSEDERTVLRRLSSFSGRFTLDGAEAVAPGGEIARYDVLDLLTGLVVRSLVQVDDRGPVARYWMLETIRDYARRRMVDAGEADDVHDRHLNFCCSVASEAAPHLVGRGSTNWLQRIDDHLDDLRRAMEWSLSAADPDRALRLAADLHWYWRARYRVEGTTRLREALQRDGGDLADRGRALVALASVEMMAGDMPAAARHAQEALEVGEHLDDPETIGRALSFLGWLTILSGPDTASAAGLLERAVAAAHAAEDHAFHALALNALGFAHIGTSSAYRARAHVEDGMRVGDQIGYDRPLMEGRLWLGFLDLFEGAFARAEESLTQALSTDDWPWDPTFRSIGRSILAEVLTAQGRYADAAAQLSLGLSEATRDRDMFGEAELRRGLAWLRYAQGHLDAARLELDAALAVLPHTDVREAARCLAIDALLALADGDSDRARRRTREAIDAGTTTDYVRALAPAHEAAALLARLDAEPDVAEDELHTMLSVSLAAGHLPGVCDALDGLAGAVGDSERFDEAARVHGAAEALRHSLGYPRRPVRCADHDRDTQRVRAALGDEAFDTASAEGRATSLDDAISYARRGRGRRSRPPYGWNSMTPTEQQVLALVTEGLTNPQIGERLFVSRRTVQSHLRHIFAKLGVATRAELAAKATARSAASSRLTRSD